MRNKVNQEWETPQKFFETIDREFHFTLDACATRENTKLDHFYTKKEDGLKQSWENERVWLNPPYDSNIGHWLRKALESSARGSLVVALIQGKSSDAKFWHDYVMKSSEIRFIKDRLAFGLKKKFSRANHSSILVIFRPDREGPPKISSIDKTGKRIEQS
jgi:phage N-6-adenine-methyltransferase